MAVPMPIPPVPSRAIETVTASTSAMPESAATRKTPARRRDCRGLILLLAGLPAAFQPDEQANGGREGQATR
jgi:hypothetical protein